MDHDKTGKIQHWHTFGKTFNAQLPKKKYIDNQCKPRLKLGSDARERGIQPALSLFALDIIPNIIMTQKSLILKKGPVKNSDTRVR